ncbi:MAG: elongator complex protein 3 [Ruminococcus sp.]
MPHNGCPHQCSFCNQKEIIGQSYQPNDADVKNVIENAINNLGNNTVNAEIAFFGGSFTAIDRKYMISLLDATKPYINRFYGIRLSTRPDYIDKEVLDILRSYKVTTIELGAQSMDDDVLRLNNRGHLSSDIVNASKLIKEYGFNLGLQMMTGLYGSSKDSDIFTAKKFIELKPDCVRIYPTVIVKNTELENLYKQGKFLPYTLEKSIDLCSNLLCLFSDNNIDVIRLGLHYSDSLVESMVYDNYHPAFKELCENRIFLNNTTKLLNNLHSKNVVAYVNRKSMSKFLGQHKSNIVKLNELGYNVNVKTDDSLGKYEIIIEEQR